MSKVKVTWTKNVSMGISMEWLLKIIDDFIDRDAKEKLRNTTVQI